MKTTVAGVDWTLGDMLPLYPGTLHWPQESEEMHFLCLSERDEVDRDDSGLRSRVWPLLFPSEHESTHGGTGPLEQE